MEILSLLGWQYFGKCPNGHEKSGVQAEVMQGSRFSFSGVLLIFSLYLQSVRDNLSSLGCLWIQGAGECFSCCFFFLLSPFFSTRVYSQLAAVFTKQNKQLFFWNCFPLVVSLLSVQVALTFHRVSRISLFIFQINSGLNRSAHELYCWEGRGLEESK